MSSRTKRFLGIRARAAVTACTALLVAGAALVALPATGQAPPSLASPPAGPPPSKACIAAGRKLAREQQSLDTAKADLDRYSKARASCATKSACARDDDRIAVLNKRIPRFATRLKTFQKDQVDACRTN
jgi:hypothetical protein